MVGDLFGKNGTAFALVIGIIVLIAIFVRLACGEMYVAWLSVSSFANTTILCGSGGRIGQTADINGFFVPCSPI